MPTPQTAVSLASHERMRKFAHSGRAEFFADFVNEELQRCEDRDELTVLDIGCGSGFHHRNDIQAGIGCYARKFIGVEPDNDAPVIPSFSQTFRCNLEDAPIPPSTVDLAYAVMVLEHVTDPVMFFRKLASIMKPGGVFLGFTVDRRHWFSWASSLIERARLKDKYLDLLHGGRGESRYENFPTAYRCNTPRALRNVSAGKFIIETGSFHKVGLLDFYIPRLARPVAHLIDRLTMSLGLPGSVLVVRATRVPGM